MRGRRNFDHCFQHGLSTYTTVATTESLNQAIEEIKQHDSAYQQLIADGEKSVRNIHHNIYSRITNILKSISRKYGDLESDEKQYLRELLRLRFFNQCNLKPPTVKYFQPSPVGDEFLPTSVGNKVKAQLLQKFSLDDYEQMTQEYNFKILINSGFKLEEDCIILHIQNLIPPKQHQDSNDEPQQEQQHDSNETTQQQANNETDNSLELSVLGNVDIDDVSQLSINSDYYLNLLDIA